MKKENNNTPKFKKKPIKTPPPQKKRRKRIFHQEFVQDILKTFFKHSSLEKRSSITSYIECFFRIVCIWYLLKFSKYAKNCWKLALDKDHLINEIAMHEKPNSTIFWVIQCLSKITNKQKLPRRKKAVKSIKQASGEPKQKQRPGNYVKFAELLM